MEYRSKRSLTFKEALTEAFGKRKVMHSGIRCRRSEFWWVTAGILLVLLLVFVPQAIVYKMCDYGQRPFGSLLDWSILIIDGIIAILLGLAEINMMIRRLNDVFRQDIKAEGWLTAGIVISIAMQVIHSYHGRPSSGLYSYLGAASEYMWWVLVFVVLLIGLKDSYKGANVFGKSPKYEEV